MVGREGFEPSKAEGRQIYSLLRLTASLPPRAVVVGVAGPVYPLLDAVRSRSLVGAGGGN